MAKIIVSLSSLKGGGAARVLSVLSKPLVDNFDEVHYLLWNGGEVFYPVDSRIKLVNLPEISGKKGRNKQVRTFRSYVKQEKPDLLLSFLTPYNMLVLLSTIGMHQKIVVAERTDPQRLLEGGRVMLWLRDMLYNRADGILTQTEYAKSYYDKKFKGKTKVIYNPITMTEEQLGRGLHTAKEKVMITVGRLEPVKGQIMMVDSFATFHKSHSDYKLIIYGDGPMKQQLEDYITDKKLQDYVTLGGHTNQVWDKMVSAECFLLTSLAEGMSNALIEAMCLGLPVISTKVSGSTDLIKDGKNGFLIDIHDKDALVSKMCQLADDEKLRLRIGSEAAKVYELLRDDKISKQWIDYLKSIINK